MLKLKKASAALLLCLLVALFGALGISAAADGENDAAPGSVSSEGSLANTVSSTVTVGEGDDAANYDLNTVRADEDGDVLGAIDYTDSYADNLQADANFESNVKKAIDTVHTEIPAYATFLSLLPPLIAIGLALITKEVYSSLFIGIVVGGILYSNFNFEGTMVHVVRTGFMNTIADPGNIGILIFLILLGAIVAMLNKTGASVAFGRWTTKHIKTRVGAQLCTILLGVLIFVDDYFNCLTVGSVMRPVTDKHNISRAKLSYLIDSTAAPVCIIAPISSWAAAVAGFASGAGAENGMELFVRAIPYNFYALLTIVMMIFLAVTNFDYGPMKKHEYNAITKGDLFTTGKEDIESEEAIDNPKGRVCDLIIPIIALVVLCILGMIYTGGFFTAGSDGYRNFVTAFSNCSAGEGLAYGSIGAIIFAVVFYLCRRVITFKQCMESLPEGFKAMVPAILILCCAWTLKTMTDSLGAKVFVSQLIEGSAGGFRMMLPAIIFLIAVGLSFATGTSWGTFGILIPIVLSVFSGTDGNITIIAISACMAGAVCGDHCSPISDTTIMSSAGAQCRHINHVSTQIPYAFTVAAVSFVSYIIAGLIQSWIALPIAIALMLGTLIVLKIFLGKKPVSED